MSRRRLERGVNHASTFSLRTMTSSVPTLQEAHAVSYKQSLLLPPPAIPVSSGLSFKFSSKSPCTPSVASIAPTDHSKPSLTGLSLSDKATAPLGAGDMRHGLLPPTIGQAPSSNPFYTSSVAENQQKNQEVVMRLTAAADDLRTRLRASLAANGALETKLKNLSSTLNNERQETAARMQSARSEVATLRNESRKAKSELAQRPKIAAIQATQFDSAVRTAIEVEETNSRAADAEMRLAKLTSDHSALQAEVALLEKAKVDALAAISTKEENDVTQTNVVKAIPVFSEEEISAKVAQMVETDAKLADATSRLNSLNNHVSQAATLLDTCREETTSAKMELGRTNKLLVIAVEDLSATKKTSSAMEEQLAHLNECVETANVNLQKAETSTANLTKRIRVYGSLPPNTSLNSAIGAHTRGVSAFGHCNEGMPATAGFDAPVALGMATSAIAAIDQVATTLVDHMVKAVVVDLRASFEAASETFSMRGLASTTDAASQETEEIAKASTDGGKAVA